MVESSPFQLSRIYALGWSAGRRCAAESLSDIQAMADSLNPYLPPGEQKRWGQGFTDAAAKHLAKPKKSGRPPKITGE